MVSLTTDNTVLHRNVLCAAEILSDVSDFAVSLQIENQWGSWVNQAGWVWFCYTTTTEEFWVQQKRRERKQTNKQKRL